MFFCLSASLGKRLCLTWRQLLQSKSWWSLSLLFSTAPAFFLKVYRHQTLPMNLLYVTPSLLFWFITTWMLVMHFGHFVTFYKITLYFSNSSLGSKNTATLLQQVRWSENIWTSGLDSFYGATGRKKLSVGPYWHHCFSCSLFTVFVLAVNNN